MLPRFIHNPDRLRHARFAWAMAWLAVLLNLAAPVIAYGAFDALRPHHAAAHAHESPAADVDPHAGHHGGEHPPQSDAASPVTPHCNYCLDFAAGALLTPAIDAGVNATRAESTVLAARETAVRSKPHLRLAYPRGPPASAS